MSIEQDIHSIAVNLEKIVDILTKQPVTAEATESKAATESKVTKEAVKENEKLQEEQTEDLTDLTEEQPLMFEEVLESFRSFAAKYGRDRCLDLFKKHGVKGKLTAESLPAENWTAFYRDCQD